jgi:hypothetical protein
LYSGEPYVLDLGFTNHIMRMGLTTCTLSTPTLMMFHLAGILCVRTQVKTMTCYMTCFGCRP